MQMIHEVRSHTPRLIAMLCALGLVAACEESPQMAFLQPKDSETQTPNSTTKSTKLVERDIEAPEVFQVTEAGLWDGRLA